MSFPSHNDLLPSQNYDDLSSSPNHDDSSSSPFHDDSLSSPSLYPLAITLCHLHQLIYNLSRWLSSSLSSDDDVVGYDAGSDAGSDEDDDGGGEDGVG